jgi:hypothetical protein
VKNAGHCLLASARQLGKMINASSSGAGIISIRQWGGRVPISVKLRNVSSLDRIAAIDRNRRTRNEIGRLAG